MTAEREAAGGAAPVLVLASGSPHRLRLLRNAGYEPLVVRPGVDERSHRWDPDDVEGYVLGLARAKLDAALTVLDTEREGDRYGYVVLAADQVVVDPGGGLCHQQPDVASATAQLMRLSGTTHELVNGVVVADPSGRTEHLIDRHRITMAAYSKSDARGYVEAHRPFECAGSYRIEDDAGFVLAVDGGDHTGVIGLPMSEVAGMLERAGIHRPV